MVSVGKRRIKTGFARRQLGLAAVDRSPRGVQFRRDAEYADRCPCGNRRVTDGRCGDCVPSATTGARRPRAHAAPTGTSVATGTSAATGTTASTPMAVVSTAAMPAAVRVARRGREQGSGAAATASIPVPTGMAAASKPGMEKIDEVFLRLLDVYQKQGQDAAIQFARDQQITHPTKRDSGDAGAGHG